MRVCCRASANRGRVVDLLDVRAADERWLPPNAVGEALILEMVQYNVGSNRSAEAADYLRKLASLFDDGARRGRCH